MKNVLKNLEHLRSQNLENVHMTIPTPMKLITLHVCASDLCICCLRKINYDVYGFSHVKAYMYMPSKCNGYALGDDW